jgi:CHAT domain-containing protein/tetratricopeptide (TPR) repeat protein
MKQTTKNPLLLCLTLLLIASVPAYPQTKSLESGKTIEQGIAAGETHSYTLTLAPGTYNLVTVDQKQINLAVTIFAADGQKLRRTDLTGVGFPEQLSLVTQAATEYRVEITAPGKQNQPGSYAIKVTETHPVTEVDKARVEAEKLTEDGVQLLVTPTAEAKPQALAKFEQSVAFWHAAKDQSWEANAYFYQAYTLNVLRQFQKAFEAAEKGLPLAHAASNKNLEAYLLDELGNSFSNRGERTKALDFFFKALALRDKSIDPVGTAYTLANIAIAYAWIGDRIKALDYMQQVAILLHDKGEQRKESTMLNNMCAINKDLGEYQKALEFCKQALEMKRDINDLSGQGVIFNNQGNVYGSMGDYQKALDLYRQSLAIHKSLNDAEGVGIEISNIAWTYTQLGEYEKANEFYAQLIDAFQKQGLNFRLASALGNIGINYAKMNDYKKALEFHLRALELRPEKDDRDGRSVSLSSIASCYANLGDKQKALDYYTEALALQRSGGDKRQIAITLTSIGVFYRDNGQIDKAFEPLNEALTLTTAIGDQNGQASVLSELAKLEFNRGNFAEAHKLIQRAIDTIESVRTNLKSQQFRTSFLASVRKYYELDVDVLMQMHQQKPNDGFAAAALQASEKGRARSLLELLHEARAEIRQGVDPALIERERSLRRTIAEKAELQMRMLSKQHTDEQAQAAAKEIEALTTEYDGVQARIRQMSPRYAALVEPSPLSVDAIQKQLLDQNTLLLEYALGEKKSFVWAVTPDSVKTFELPGRAAIEQQAKRFYQLLTERGLSVPSETLAQRNQRLAHGDSDYPQVAASLSRMLLAPLAAELRQKRLVIVAEGVLQYVPFAALPAPESTNPLIVDHEIVTLPSASVLAVLREEFGNRKPASNTVAVFADPVFSTNDARLAQGGHAAAAETVSFTDAQRSATAVGLDSLERLRFSRQEAEDIARLAGDRRNLKALDFSANRAMVTDAKLSDYRIVHFATHGLINNQYPDLSGIVLSLVDEKGRPQNGFLRLYDIYNLKLNADLVVLSACQTALGKEIKGEGLMGLTRGFMYAGAPRVVASLWRIDDRASAEIMKRFYEAMLKDGLPPAAALRAAQISMARDKRWQSPHFWAAFTLQGEWH